jgi:hypothetical protein
LLVCREFGLLAGTAVKSFVFGQVKVVTKFYPMHSKWETRGRKGCGKLLSAGDISEEGDLGGE